jgi:membrane protein required for colicin V production
MEESFNLFDVAVVVIIGLSALLSFYRGLVREILSLSGWVVASLTALTFLEPATKFLKPFISNEAVAVGVASISLFFITLILFSIVTGLIVKVLKIGDKVGLFDNLGGLAFGVARGLLIVSIGYFIMGIVVNEKDSPKWLKEAKTRPFVAQTSTYIAKVAPDYLSAATKEKDKLAEKTKKAVEENQDKSNLPTMEELQQRIRDENERQ